MKFILFVEGETEKKCLASFFKQWLDPRLPVPVGIQVVRFDGWAELIKDTPTKTCLHLGKSDVIAVIALLDLHGPTIYPSDRVNAVDRHAWGKQELEKKVGNHARFRQFFAVHETEAWLLSDSSIFPSDVARAVRSRVRQPEDVNFDKPPAKLLDELYRENTGRNYKKVAHGTDLFGRLKVETAYQKCPYLKEMLDEMLSLASDALKALGD